MKFLFFNIRNIVKHLALLALANLVLDLANLVSNLAKKKPYHQPDQT